MKSGTLVACCLGATLLGIPPVGSSPPPASPDEAADTTREITRLVDERQAAFGRRDRAAYQVFLDPAAIFAEPGNIHSGLEQIAQAKPTVGFKEVGEHGAPKVTSFGSSAVAVYTQSVRQIYGEQSFSEHWTTVDTFTKADGRWKLIAHVEVPHPLQRKAVEVAPALLARYVGTYRWAQGYVDKVSFSGGKLMAQATDEDTPNELHALDETTFFITGDDGLLIFEKDGSGGISRYRWRSREGEEIVAKKIE